MRRLKVLLTAVSGPGGVGIANALKSHPFADITIIGGRVEAEPDPASMLFCSQTVKIPYAKDPLFIDKMLDICAENDIDILLPAFSDESVRLSEKENLEKFEKIGTKVLVPNHQNVIDCHYKDRLDSKISQSFPEYLISYEMADDMAELETAAYKLGYPERMVCLKPAVCNGGSRGFAVLDMNYDPVKNFFYEKSSNTFTLEEFMLKFKNCSSIPRLIVMEYIDMPEYGADILAKNGRVISCVLREKLPPMLANMNMKIKLVQNEVMNNMVNDISGALNLTGLFNMDLFYRKGIAKLIEINPRQGAYIGSVVGRCNLLAAAIDMLTGDFKAISGYENTAKDITAVRYIEEFAIWDGKTVKYKK